MNKRQLRREYRAFLGHYYTLCGLDVLARIRIRQFLDALRDARNEHSTKDEQIRAVRAQILSQHMNGDPRARMAWDVPNEIDTYTWGPIELFFCSAQAMMDRYHKLKEAYPEIAFQPLDDYIIDHRPIFENVKHLRDWVTHPGLSRNAHEALSEISQEYDERGVRPFYEIVRALIDLYQKFLERLGNHAR